MNHGFEIQEAQNLFRKFELTEDHSDRIRLLEDVLDLLDDYILDQDEPQVRIATNLRRTFTRKLIEKLPDLNSLDIADWFSYSKILLTRLNKEVKTICAEDMGLQKAHDAFIKIWADEAIALIQNNFPEKFG